MYLRAVGGPAGDTAGTAEDEEPDRQGPESWEGAGGQAFPAAAGLGERVRAARVLLDRPLTSYYLIVGITMLLLGLGLVMVLSTASVTDLAYGESPYYDFERQLAGVVIGLPVMWLAARSSPRLFRAAAYPLVAIAVIGLGLTLIHGVGQVQNGAARWIQLGPLQFQPSELAKLALAVWGADLLARKEKLGLLADWRHILVPLMPGVGLLAMLVMAGDDLGTTFILLLIFLALLWFAGTPGRVFTVLLILMGLVLVLLTWWRSLPARTAHRVLGPDEHQPGRTEPADASRANTRSGPAGSSASASARAGRSGGGCPSPPATSSSRSSGRSWAWWARSA